MIELLYNIGTIKFKLYKFVVLYTLFSVYKYVISKNENT